VVCPVAPQAYRLYPQLERVSCSWRIAEDFLRLWEISIVFFFGSIYIYNACEIILSNLRCNRRNLPVDIRNTRKNSLETKIW
jgi:hypothetical protein